jgi:signal peptidase II
LAAALTVIADVTTKVTAVYVLSAEPVDLRIIEFRLVRNSGVAFGVGAFLAPGVLLALTACVALAMAVGVWRGSLPTGTADGLVIGGATSNLVDRLIGGTVIDMIDLGWWPAFNVADVSIVVGVGMLLIQSIQAQGRVAEGRA